MNINKWIAHEAIKEDNKIALLCFIFDGGSASYFSAWKYNIHEDVDIIPILYPMREKRRNEPMYENMEVFVRELVLSLEDIFRSKRYAFFGYCSGSIIAYETAVLAKQLYGTEPEYGMIISSEAPEFLKDSIPVITDENREKSFFEHLSGLPSIDEKTLHDKVFLDYYKPLFTADHDLLESYKYKKHDKLNCDFDVIICPDDPKVQKEKAEKWKELTSGNTSIINKDGGHFLADSQKEYIFNTLNERLSGTDASYEASVPEEKSDFKATPTEMKVIDIWSKVYGKEGFRPDDNFFLTGGDSLKAVRIINEISRIFGVEVSIKDVFNNAEISEFAAFVEELITKKAEISENYIDEGEI